MDKPLYHVFCTVSIWVKPCESERKSQMFEHNYTWRCKHRMHFPKTWLRVQYANLLILNDIWPCNIQFTDRSVKAEIGNTHLDTPICKLTNCTDRPCLVMS